jgi:hypothetical protein
MPDEKNIQKQGKTSLETSTHSITTMMEKGMDGVRMRNTFGEVSTLDTMRKMDQNQGLLR